MICAVAVDQLKVEVADINRFEQIAHITVVLNREMIAVDRNILDVSEMILALAVNIRFLGRSYFDKLRGHRHVSVGHIEYIVDDLNIVFIAALVCSRNPHDSVALFGSDRQRHFVIELRRSRTGNGSVFGIHICDCIVFLFKRRFNSHVVRRHCKFIARNRYFAVAAVLNGNCIKLIAAVWRDGEINLVSDIRGMHAGYNAVFGSIVGNRVIICRECCRYGYIACRHSKLAVGYGKLIITVVLYADRGELVARIGSNCESNFLSDIGLAFIGGYRAVCCVSNRYS